MIHVNGEEIAELEAKSVLRMLYKDAKEIAGEFHNMNRSAKFRVNWPDQYKFANSEWRNFIEAARAMYAERLGDPKTPPEDARRMHLALVIDAMAGKNRPKDNRLQIAPNTQQFVGDPYENRKIAEKFGKNQNLRAALLNATATRH